MKLKVCGMKESSNIKELEKISPDLMGFIFYPKSKRFVENLDKAVLDNLKKEIIKVGVFVNEEFDFITANTAKYGINYVQLHGEESPALCLQLKQNGYKVIKVFPVADDLPHNLDDYSDSTDFFLFDTKTSDYGGSGKKFNWELLKKYNNSKPLFLSGGIDLESVEEIRSLSGINIYAVDINSRFEIEPGLKEIEKIKEFKNRLMA